MLIVLSGTSSSGKTTLAKALQMLSPRPLLHLEADRFAPTLPPQHPALQDEHFRSRGVIAMHEAIAVFGRSGLDVIVDGSLPTDPSCAIDVSLFCATFRTPGSSLFAAPSRLCVSESVLDPTGRSVGRKSSSGGSTKACNSTPSLTPRQPRQMKRRVT